MTKAKVFMTGRSQAIRLPKEFRVAGNEVYLRRNKDGFAVIECDPWDLLKEGCKELSEDFLRERKQPALQKRDWRE